jgi:hypothetical protein
MVTQEFIDSVIENDGPWLFHIARPRLKRRIFRLGLLPNGEFGVHTAYSGNTEPRPGHVYLCTGECLPLIAEQLMAKDWSWDDPEDRALVLSATVAIDIRGLDPASFSPDEDCCYNSKLMQLQGCPFISVPNVRPADNVVMGLGIPDAPYCSFGEWAETESVGDCPAHTEACWSAFGSLAYRGKIPSHLLRDASQFK